ncbi:MAG: ATP synthase F1 subunit gamma [Candidatus Hydrogenedentota bacterium]
MASLRDIKRRITSVQSTQKITRAMKMVAAAKLRRSQDAIVRARPYAYHLRDLVNNLTKRAEEDIHPLLRQGAGKKIGLVVVTSDRGLCGGYNSNLVNETMSALHSQFRENDVELTVIGRKGIEALTRRDCTIRKTYRNLFEGNVLRSAGEIIGEIADEYEQGATHAVYCLYNEFKSAISQRVTLERLLPFEAMDDPGALVVDYLYEPSAESILDRLLRHHLQMQMHRMLFEAAASEHGARMTAMDAATNNAGDMIERLTLHYNRARQATITTEMIDIVGGAEAL